MNTRERILETLRQAAPDLEREYGITRLALIGSFARGEATEASDVDVLVDVDPSIGLRFVDLAERIEALLAMPTNVVSRRAVTPRHSVEIEKDRLDVA